MQGRTLDFCVVRTLKLCANLMMSVQQLMQAVQTQLLDFCAGKLMQIVQHLMGRTIPRFLCK